MSDLRAADPVGVKNTERRRIQVQGNKIDAADIRVSNLVNVRDICSGDIRWVPLPPALVTKLLPFITQEDSFPHDPTDKHAPRQTIHYDHVSGCVVRVASKAQAVLHNHFEQRDGASNCLL